MATTKKIAGISLNQDVLPINAVGLLFGVCCMAFCFIGLNMVQPWLLEHHLNLPTSETGDATGTLGAIGQIITVLLAGAMGALADIKGRRLVLILGVVVMGLGACAVGCFRWADRRFAGYETSGCLLRSATRGHRPAGERRMLADEPAGRADWGRIAWFHVAASPCIRFMFSARHTSAHSPRAGSRPRTLKRRKPSACLIHPLGASDSHLRLA